VQSVLRFTSSMKFLKWCFESIAHVVALQKIVQALTGLVTASLVTIYLTPDEQGYFFTMGSLLSSYILLDLGLSNLLIQFSARSFTGLSWHKQEIVDASDGQKKSNFLDLVSWTLRWYAFAGLATFLLIPIGYIYFHFAKSTVDVAWQLPWIAIVSSVALSMPAIGLLSILEGAEKIRVTYTLRIAHYLLGAIVAWMLLIQGHGLFAQSMAPLAIAVVVIYWLKKHYGTLLKNHLFNKSNFNWKLHVWPQQKRVTVSWFSNYLFLHVPVPVVFYFSGARIAGKMGLSMVVANVVGAIAMSWVTAATPRITKLIAQGDVDEGRALFERSLLTAVFLLLIGGLAASGLTVLIHGYSLSERILNPSQLILLFFVFALFHGINALIVYFRAFKKEPLALPSLIATSSIVVIGCFVVPLYSVNGAICLMAIVYSLFSFYAWRLFKGFTS